MLRLSSALAAVAVAKAMSRAEIDNECYDFWNKLEESGIGEFDELNVNVGSNVNAGKITNVGTGTALNFGRNHLVHVSENGDFGIGMGSTAGNADKRIDTSVGTNVNLKGGLAVAVETGVGENREGAISNVDLYEGLLKDLHVPGFDTMNGGVGQVGDLQGRWGAVHRTGGGVNNQGYGVDYGHDDLARYSTNMGRRRSRRRLLQEMCGPPPATGGKPVTCASTGDPHIRDFRGRKFDHMAFGEFIFYNSWQPVSHHPHTNLKIHVRNGPFLGNQRIASNHGIAIAGKLACHNKYEILKTGPKNYSTLKITRSNGRVDKATGKQNIYNMLARENCVKVQIANDVAHFIFEEDSNQDKTTLRVQIVNYGLNLGLDVLGSTVRLETDRGVCTKNAGWDMQLECSHSLFSTYPSGSCATLQRGGERGGPPQKCDKTLFNMATARCSKCPETVNPKGCVYDVCALGDIKFADEVLSACSVGVRLPKRMNVNTGTAINMEGAESYNAGRGTGINYGVNNVRVIQG